MFIPRQASAHPDPNASVKRTASLLSLPLNEFLSIDYDPLRNSQITAPIATLKSLPAQRRVLPMARSSAEPMKLASGVEFDRMSNASPAIITIPNLIDCATRFHRSTSIVEGESRSRLSIAAGHSRSTTTTKRYFSDRINDYVIQQPSSSMEMLLRERPITATLETNYSTSPVGRVNPLVKKRLYWSPVNRQNHRFAFSSLPLLFLLLFDRESMLINACHTSLHELDQIPIEFVSHRTI